MSGATTAVAIGAGVAGAASLGGALIQSNAASSAASKQAAAENNATAAQQGIYAQNQQNLQPFIQTGTNASNEVSQLEGLNGGTSSTIQNTLQNLPGYQFSNTQGLKAVQNAASERGLATSGAALKGASNFATGNANTYYNNLLTGVQNTANMGANAAGGLASVGATTGQGIAGTTVGAGNALAQGITGSANAVSGGLNGLGSAVYSNEILQNINGQGGSNNNGFNNSNIINYSDNSPNNGFTDWQE